MKIKSVVYYFVIVVVFVILAISCKKGNDANNLTPNIPAPDGTVTDIEGNVYPTMKIGTQSWMVENLRVTKFNDNTAIPLVTNATDWKILFTPGYCWYNNDPATNKNIYGALYNWYTVNTGKLCPTGWHVPTDAEWITLTTYLGNVNAGGKLKETGTTHWLVPNTGATNESGFTALPGGSRWYDGVFGGIIGDHGGWWSSTTVNGDPIYRYVYNNSSMVAHLVGDSNQALSVRCVKD